MAKSLKQITLQSLSQMLPQELITSLAQTCITRVYSLHDRIYYGKSRAGGYFVIFRGCFSALAQALTRLGSIAPQMRWSFES